MSFITPGTVQAIAHSLDIPLLSDEAAKALAPDVEYKLREVIQEALKFAKHSKRVKLTTEDINNALRLRNVEPLYGFGSRDKSRFVRAAGHPDVYYLADPERPIGQIVEAPLPKVPRDVGLAAHWLAINGQQPSVPENAPIEQPPPKRPRLDPSALQKQAAAAAAQAQAAAAAAAAQRQDAGKDGGGKGARVGAGGGGGAGAGGALAGGVAVQPPVRHSLSRELQVYFDRLVGLLQAAAAAEAASGAPPDAPLAPPPPAGAPAAAAADGKPPANGAAANGMPPPPAPGAAAAAERHEALFRAALTSLASDPGLHPLAPYFTAYIADGVAQNLSRLPLLRRLLCLARALLVNPDIQMELYLNQLLPAVATCVLTAQLGPRGGDDHWALREQAGELAALAARLFGQPYHNVGPRLVRLMAKAFMDPAKGFACKYGAAVGLQALGPKVVRTALLPHLEPFVSTVLLPALGGAEAPAAAAAADAGASPEAAAERELSRRDARRLFGALAAAAGAAMYDRLIGLLADRLPEHVVLRRGPQPAGGRGWDELDKAAALAARARVLVRQRPLRVRVVASAAGGGGGGGGGSGGVALDIEEVSLEEVTEVLKRDAASWQAAGGGGGGGGELGALLERQAPPGGGRRGGGGKGGGRGGGGAKRAPAAQSIAEVLADAWKEDSDVNAQLGALVHLFGEAVLAQLPLGHLPAYNM